MAKISIFLILVISFIFGFIYLQLGLVAGGTSSISISIRKPDYTLVVSQAGMSCGSSTCNNGNPNRTQVTCTYAYNTCAQVGWYQGYIYKTHSGNNCYDTNIDNTQGGYGHTGCVPGPNCPFDSATTSETYGWTNLYECIANGTSNCATAGKKCLDTSTCCADGYCKWDCCTSSDCATGYWCNATKQCQQQPRSLATIDIKNPSGGLVVTNASMTCPNSGYGSCNDLAATGSCPSGCTCIGTSGGVGSDSSANRSQESCTYAYSACAQTGNYTAQVYYSYTGYNCYDSSVGGGYTPSSGTCRAGNICTFDTCSQNEKISWKSLYQCVANGSACNNADFKCLDTSTCCADLKCKDQCCVDADCLSGYKCNAAKSCVLSDTIPPVWSNNKTNPTAPTEYQTTKTYQFNITWTDATTSIANVSFQWTNSSGTFNESWHLGQVSKDGNVYYVTKNNLSPYDYKYKWYAKDQGDNWNSTSLMGYSVIQVANTTMKITIYNPSGGIVVNNASMTCTLNGVTTCGNFATTNATCGFSSDSSANRSQMTCTYPYSTCAAVGFYTAVVYPFHSGFNCYDPTIGAGYFPASCNPTTCSLDTCSQYEKYPTSGSRSIYQCVVNGSTCNNGDLKCLDVSTCCADLKCKDQCCVNADCGGGKTCNALKQCVLSDTIPPVWSNNITSPTAPTEYQTTKTYQFNITWTDATTSIANVSFQWTNSSGTFNESWHLGQVSKDGNVYYVTKNNLSPYDYKYKWYAKDQGDNWNSTPLMSYPVTQVANTTIKITVYNPSGGIVVNNASMTCTLNGVTTCGNFAYTNATCGFSSDSSANRSQMTCTYPYSTCAAVGFYTAVVYPYHTGFNCYDISIGAGYSPASCSPSVCALDTCSQNEKYPTSGSTILYQCVVNGSTCNNGDLKCLDVSTCCADLKCKNQCCVDADCLSGYKCNAAKSCVVLDTIPPVWSNNITSPTAPTEYQTTKTYQFNITWTDNQGIANVSFEWTNSSGAFNESWHLGQVSKDGNVYYVTKYNLGSEYKYRWFAKDLADNWASTPLMIFSIWHVANTTMKITIYNPSKQIVVNNDSMTCTLNGITTCDNFAATNATCGFNLDSSANRSQMTCTYPFSMCAELGNYTAAVYPFHSGFNCYDPTIGAGYFPASCNPTTCALDTCSQYERYPTSGNKSLYKCVAGSKECNNIDLRCLDTSTCCADNLCKGECCTDEDCQELYKEDCQQVYVCNPNKYCVKEEFRFCYTNDTSCPNPYKMNLYAKTPSEQECVMKTCCSDLANLQCTKNFTICSEPGVYQMKSNTYNSGQFLSSSGWRDIYTVTSTNPCISIDCQKNSTCPSGQYKIDLYIKSPYGSECLVKSCCGSENLECYQTYQSCLPTGTYQGKADMYYGTQFFSTSGWNDLFTTEFNNPCPTGTVRYGPSACVINGYSTEDRMAYWSPVIKGTIKNICFRSASPSDNVNYYIRETPTGNNIYTGTATFKEGWTCGNASLLWNYETLALGKTSGRVAYSTVTSGGNSYNGATQELTIDRWYAVCIEPQKDYYQLSINPSSANSSNVSAEWDISATDSSFGVCVNNINYTISYSTSEACNLTQTSVDPTKFTIAKGGTLSPAFKVKATSNKTSNCTVRVNVIDPDVKTVATGIYISNYTGLGTLCDYDGICDPGENCQTCPSDCICPGCGDNNCSFPTENCQNCVKDCGCLNGTCCDNVTKTCISDCVSNCNYNTTCNLGESCSCSDCFGKKDACADDLVCNATTKECNCPSDKPYWCLTPAPPHCDNSSDCLCGDGIKDPNENCRNCPPDAGCSGTQICCDDGVCRNTCPTGWCDYNQICDLNENCNCSDCFGWYDRCSYGLVCNETQTCYCNPIKDGICPNDIVCRLIDPDCKCVCGQWYDLGCGLSPCTSTQTKQIRYCTPSFCPEEIQCVAAATCLSNFYYSADVKYFNVFWHAYYPPSEPDPNRRIGIECTFNCDPRTSTDQCASAQRCLPYPVLQTPGPSSCSVVNPAYQYGIGKDKVVCRVYDYDNPTRESWY